MKLNFKPFANAVHDQFVMMSKHELFTTKLDGDTIYAAYLKAFPAGTNPMYRKATEHECSCCRNFIKNVGGLVAIIDGRVVTVWDNVATGDAYEIVAADLAKLVATAEIEGIFRTSEPSYGASVTKELMEDGSVHSWNHFHAKIAAKHYATDPGAQRGVFTAAKDVFTRGLKELTMAALDD